MRRGTRPLLHGPRIRRLLLHLRRRPHAASLHLFVRSTERVPVVTLPDSSELAAAADVASSSADRGLVVPPRSGRRAPRLRLAPRLPLTRLMQLARPRSSAEVGRRAVQAAAVPTAPERTRRRSRPSRGACRERCSRRRAASAASTSRPRIRTDQRGARADTVLCGRIGSIRSGPRREGIPTDAWGNG